MPFEMFLLVVSPLYCLTHIALLLQMGVVRLVLAHTHTHIHKYTDHWAWTTCFYMRRVKVIKILSRPYASLRSLFHYGKKEERKRATAFIASSTMHSNRRIWIQWAKNHPQSRCRCTRHHHSMNEEEALYEIVIIYSFFSLPFFLFNMFSLLFLLLFFFSNFPSNHLFRCNVHLVFNIKLYHPYPLTDHKIQRFGHFLLFFVACKIT